MSIYRTPLPLLYILIVFIWASSTGHSCFGILEENDSETITFLALSLLQTYLTIILSVIGSINIRKGGQLDTKAKILLGLSLSCQMVARFLVMVNIAVAAISEDSKSISITTAALLLLLPMGTSWASSILLHARLNTDFLLLSTKSKLIHLLSTTWFTLPVRRLGERDQRHKGREMTFGCILATINLVGTIAACWYFGLLSYGGFLLPPLPLHLIGCGLLLCFEKTAHPWRQLSKERQRRRLGKLQGSKKGIEAEPTIWEQV